MPRSMVYLALSYDHRIVDGADAARFLTTMKERLEAGHFEADLGLYREGLNPIPYPGGIRPREGCLVWSGSSDFLVRALLGRRSGQGGNDPARRPAGQRTRQLA